MHFCNILSSYFLLPLCKHPTMTKSSKILVGIFSILPIILLVVYMIFAFRMFFSVMQYPMEMQDANYSSSIFLKGMIPAIIVALIMSLASLGMLIYFIVHVINNKALDGNERLIWILVFIFAGMVGFPIYWYMRIWKSSPPPVTSSI